MSYLHDLELRTLRINGTIYHRIMYRVRGRNTRWGTYKTVLGTRLYRLEEWGAACKEKHAIECAAFYRYCQILPDLKELYEEGYALGVELREQTPPSITGHYDIYSSEWLLDCEVKSRYMKVLLPTIDQNRARLQGIHDGFKGILAIYHVAFSFLRGSNHVRSVH